MDAKRWAALLVGIAALVLVVNVIVSQPEVLPDRSGPIPSASPTSEVSQALE